MLLLCLVCLLALTISNTHQAADSSVLLQSSPNVEIDGARDWTEDVLGDSPVCKKLMKWCAKQSLQVDTSTWPALKAIRKRKDGNADAWEWGLKNLQVYVISLETDAKRRENFAEEWLRQDFATDTVRWFPAINGSSVPPSFGNPHEGNATGAEAAFLGRPGVLGAFLSHLSVLLQSHKSCPHCDVMVFEDDVVFHPNFKVLWREFVENAPASVYDETLRKRVPVGLLHFGGDVFWDRPRGKGHAYWQATAPSRGWGYAIKAKYVHAMASYMWKVDRNADMGFDQVITDDELLKQFAVLTPKVPLVAQIANHSSTAAANGTELLVHDAGVIKTRPDWKNMCWHATYADDMPCIETVYDTPA
jgi:GR25 family glycosyltransferase involved in LPS biosynthesis